MKTEHKSVRKNVKALVDTFPEVAENYNSLCGAYWIVFDNCTDISDIKKGTPAETITRHLRKLVEEGAVKIPDRVKKARQEKEVEFRNEFSTIA